tara:strand:- start:1007 stop:1720 length:714 start_codon:yes stop_codon:yes gene_type:complete
MASLKNWDNQTWLSSKEYISSFTNFVLKQKKLTKNSSVLDIGCGRGKILEHISSKIKLVNKPIGIDVENHKDKSKKMIFKKGDGLNHIINSKNTFDLIIIKQAIHFFKTKQIIKLLSSCKNKLNPNGKIMILSLDPKKNDIPTFDLMNKKLRYSLIRDKKIFDLIYKTFSKIIIKSFLFKVSISKKKYLNMIEKKYISILLNFNQREINIGLSEINHKYKKMIKFNDRLICLILSKN